MGMSREDSSTIAEVLLESDLMGIESHGLQRLIMYYNGIQIGRINPKAKIKVTHETPVSALIDGDDGFWSCGRKDGYADGNRQGKKNRNWSGAG